jgi:phage baseplate assembly protein W
MAIIDKQIKVDNKTGKQISNWYTADRDEGVLIGIKLPIVLAEGSEASSTTTLEAVKSNLMNLCSTEVGERIMQPNLGVGLKRFLFEPFTEDIIFQVQDTIMRSIKYWLPFINLNDIQVKMSDNESGDFRSVMEVKIDFNLKKDPTSHESIQLTISN